MPETLQILNRELVGCTRCQRLVEHREKMALEKRRAYVDWDYWGKPVPGFGDPKARVLLLGLAPGAHGSNRTGRPFTGDASGNFMYPVLHKTGFASQANSESLHDGMRLRDAYITSVVRCAPPDNKPAIHELANCATFLDRELAALKNLRVVVALGKIAFDGYFAHLKRQGTALRRAAYPFGHGELYKLPNGIWLLASYHPSQQNTLTGRLTEKMFVQIFRRARKLAEAEAV